MKELSTRKFRAAETRTRIYETAKALFSKYGYEAVSVDDIVREAGVSRGSFYVYFLSKEDLSIYMMMDGLGALQEDVKKAWEKLDKTKTASELILETALCIISMTESMSVETVRTMYKIFISRSASTGASVKEIFEMPFLFTELYNLGVKRGEFIETDVHSFAENMKIILEGLTLEWCLYHPNIDFIGKTINLVSCYLRGFKKPESLQLI